MDGIIPSVRAFCFRRIEDMIIGEGIGLPVRTLERDRPGKVDLRFRVRIEAFLDLVRARKRKR